MFKFKNTIFTFVTIFAIGFSATSGNAQEYEPWTGSVVGATINLGNNKSLKTIRKLINKGNTTGAVREARKLVTRLSLNNRSGEVTRIQYDAFNALCISLTANKEYDEAMISCNDAIKHTPGHWKAINSRGSLNYKTGNFSEALEDYRLALAKAPNSKNIRWVIEHNIEISQARISEN